MKSGCPRTSRGTLASTFIPGFLPPSKNPPWSTNLSFQFLILSSTAVWRSVGSAKLRSGSTPPSSMYLSGGPPGGPPDKYIELGGVDPDLNLADPTDLQTAVDDSIRNWNDKLVDQGGFFEGGRNPGMNVEARVPREVLGHPDFISYVNNMRSAIGTNLNFLPVR